MAFRVGMKVVCIDDATHQGIICKQAVYVITGILPIPDRPTTGPYAYARILLQLRGVSNPTMKEGGGGFAADRFRPVAYPKQSEADDIAMIRELIERIDPILACELTYADEIEARMERIDRLWEAMR